MTPTQQGPVTIDAVIQLLRDERMRGFRIDIETDSLVEADQTKERQDATELVTAIGTFFKEFGPVVQQMPPLAPLASDLLQFAVRRFKVGSEMEECIQKAMDGVVQHLNNPSPPQPNPDDQAKLAITQKKGEAEIAKAQLSVQEATARIEGEAKLRDQAAQHAANEDQRKAALHELEKEAKVIAHHHDMETKDLERAFAKQVHESGLEKMHHEAGIKAQSAEHDVALKKDATSHDMALKEKQAKGSEEDKKTSAESKSKLEKLFAEISKSLTSKKKIVRDSKGEITAIEPDGK